MCHCLREAGAASEQTGSKRLVSSSQGPHFVMSPEHMPALAQPLPQLASAPQNLQRRYHLPQEDAQAGGLGHNPRGGRSLGSLDLPRAGRRRRRLLTLLRRFWCCKGSLWHRRMPHGSQQLRGRAWLPEENQRGQHRQGLGQLQNQGPAAVSVTSLTHCSASCIRQSGTNLASCGIMALPAPAALVAAIAPRRAAPRAPRAAARFAASAGEGADLCERRDQKGHGLDGVDVVERLFGLAKAASGSLGGHGYR